MKKLVSLLLCVVLCLGALPMTVHAEETTAQPPVKYLDSYGREQEVTNYTILDGSADMDSVKGGWYVVKLNNYNFGERTYNLEKDLHLILCDGAEMKIGEEGDDGTLCGSKLTITGADVFIYAQSTGENAGKLTVTNGTQDGNISYGINVTKNLTINGGIISVKDDGIGKDNADIISYGICVNGKLTINGGTVTATAGDAEVTCDENANTNNVCSAMSCGIFASEVLVKNATVTATSGTAKVINSAENLQISTGCFSYGIRSQWPVEFYNSTVNATVNANNTGNGERVKYYGIYSQQGDILMDHSKVTVALDGNGGDKYGYFYAYDGKRDVIGNAAELSVSGGGTEHPKLTGSFASISSTFEPLNTLIADKNKDYAFYGDDGSVKDGSTKTLTNVTVKEHTHNYATKIEGKESYICACGAPNNQKSVAYIDYVDGKAVTKYATSYDVITSGTYNIGSGYHVVRGEVTIDGTLNCGGDGVEGSVNIILEDNAELKVNRITHQASSGDLVVYAQSDGDTTGKLTVDGGTSEREAIFSNRNGIVINGGIVTAKSDYREGDACGVSAFALTVNGGKLTATSGNSENDNSYGIKVTTLNVNGGTVIGNSGTVKDGKNSYGISATNLNVTGGTLETDGDIWTYNPNISGGTVTVAGSLDLQSGERPEKGISTGTFGMINCLDSGTTLMGNIADGYALFDTTTSELKKAHEKQCKNVTVKPHECSYDKDSDGVYSCTCGRKELDEPIMYLDENGKTRYCTNYAYMTSNRTSDWLVIDEGYENNNTFEITQDTNLILCDGATAAFNKGIYISDDCTLTIYAQSKDENMGTMTVNGLDDSTLQGSAIYSLNGKLVVNGGKITANGVEYADNITCAIYAYDFEMNGGEVTATGAAPNADGTTHGVYVTNNLTINGGKLTGKTVENANSAKGISVLGDYIQTGGTVEATRAKTKNDPDSSSSFGLYVYGNATVSGGTLSVTGNETVEEVGGCEIFITETMTLSGGTISATSSKGENVRITGDTLKMSGGEIETEKTVLFFFNYDISGDSAFTLEKGTAFYSFTVSGNVALQSFLPAGCAYTKDAYHDEDETFGEHIDFVNLNTTTQLVSSWADEKYIYYVVPCTEHSGNPCVYCGKKTSTSGGSYTPTETVTVTQPAVGGSVEVNNPAPTEGETVVVTPKKDNGYVIDTIKVTDENGKTIEISRNSDGTFDFTQPDGEVTIEVTYTEKPDFKDVPKDAWYGEALDFAVENGILSGTSKTTFEPNEPMTRAMFATVLWCYVGKPDSFTGSFSDIKNGDWFKEAVAWASKNDVVSGTGNGKFEPDLEITREEMVVMLWNFCGKPESTGKLSGFTDANKVSSWAQAAMAWAVENGIISGKGNGVLDPLGTATRAEVTAMIVNFVNK